MVAPTMAGAQVLYGWTMFSVPARNAPWLSVGLMAGVTRTAPTAKMWL